MELALHKCIMLYCDVYKYYQGNHSSVIFYWHIKV